MVLKPGLLPRSWLVSWIGFINSVFVVFWVSVELSSGKNISLLAGRFGMIESIGDLLTQYRLRWLGHIARMSDTKQPKKLCLVDSLRSALLMVPSSVGGIRSVRICGSVVWASHLGIKNYKIIPDGDLSVMKDLFIT